MVIAGFYASHCKPAYLILSLFHCKGQLALVLNGTIAQQYSGAEEPIMEYSNIFFKDFLSLFLLFASKAIVCCCSGSSLTISLQSISKWGFLYDKHDLKY